jgi:hypothetical protein
MMKVTEILSNDLYKRIRTIIEENLAKATVCFIAGI